MLKLSQVSAQSFSDRIGAERMQPLPPPASDEEQVSLGSGGAALRTRDHAAIVYWSDAELLECVVPYLRAGLEAGDKVVYVADATPVETVLQSLRRAGVDVEAETTRGSLTVLTAAQAFFGDGRFEVERALAGVRELAAQAAR